jgi:hypothetical protein
MSHWENQLKAAKFLSFTYIRMSLSPFSFLKKINNQVHRPLSLGAPYLWLVTRNLEISVDQQSRYGAAPYWCVSFQAVTITCIVIANARL